MSNHPLSIKGWQLSELQVLASPTSGNTRFHDSVGLAYAAFVHTVQELVCKAGRRGL